MEQENKTEGTVQTKQLPTSTPAHLKMLKFTPEAYAGITPDQSVVVIFPDGEPLVEFKGDQGTTKSSNLSALKTLLGAEEPANAVNSDTGKKSAELSFMVGGAQYVSRVTRTGFTLTEIKKMPNGKDMKSEIKKPKEVLKGLIGPLGSDPLFLKSKNPKDQLKFVREMMVLTEEFQGLEAEINQSYTDAYKSRTAANRIVSDYGANLLQAGEYFAVSKDKVVVKSHTYSSAEEKYSIDLKERDEAILKEFNSAREKANSFTSKEASLQSAKKNIKSYTDAITDFESQIKELQIRLQNGRDTLAFTIKDVEKLETELAQKAPAEKALESATEALQQSNEFKQNKVAFDAATKMFDDYQAAIASQQSLNVKLDLLSEQKQEMVKQITPDIQGLEICIPTEVDVEFETVMFKEKYPDATIQEVAKGIAEKVAAANREGIYYNGRSVAELSESELWELWLQLCNVSGVKAVFIENISSLGTHAIEKINALAAKGCNVFYSAMQRGLPVLQISFFTQIK